MKTADILNHLFESDVRHAAAGGTARGAISAAINNLEAVLHYRGMPEDVKEELESILDLLQSALEKSNDYIEHGAGTGIEPLARNLHPERPSKAYRKAFGGVRGEF